MNNKEKSFNKAEYDNNFQKENYDRIVIKVKKGKKKELETHIADFGYKNVSTFIKYNLVYYGYCTCKCIIV